MKEQLIIIGASGHGKVVADIAEKLNHWKSIYFLDDNASINTNMGYKVIGKTSDFLNHLDISDFFVAIGDNKIRQQVQEEIIKAKGSIISLIHPKATIGSDVTIGSGTAIMAGVVINPDTSIGSGCIINTSVSLDHDNTIKDYVHISPGAHLAGTVSIGERTWIGMGASIINNVSITNDTIIGAGALVLRDINETGTYVGIPIRKLNGVNLKK